MSTLLFSEVKVSAHVSLGALILLFAGPLAAQTNVVTQHYDIGRTGANTNETILTPANVNSSSFGKLFYYVVDGYVYAQPLYMSSITMGAGTPQGGSKHNVVFVATEHDTVYAFDADSNLGANANPLWRITLLDSAHGAASGATPVPPQDTGETDIVPEYGITGTPVIDPATGTMYLVGLTKENNVDVARLHALDISTGAEKFGGPVTLAASVPGNGNGSVSGTLQFTAQWENQRPGLLLLNGIVYIAFASHNDSGPWHGWILAYNAATLKQTGAWCSSPNGFGAGIWESGTGLTASVTDPTGHPYGSLFSATGTGTFDATSAPYNDSMDFSVSVFKLDLSNGQPSVVDDFTPFDEASLTNSNMDQGSGGPLVLPAAVSGGKNLIVQVGKTGRVYVFDQSNLGGYHPGNTSDPQQQALVKGQVYGGISYWNGRVYIQAVNDRLKAFPIANGVLSSTPSSIGTQVFGFPGTTTTVSANGNTNGIVWTVKTDAFDSQGPGVLFANDASNVANLLYSSAQNATRDTAGGAVKFSTPTIVNGKVYLGGEYQLAVYGLLNGATQAAQPVINPAGQLFHPSIQVTITDSSSNAQIFYTTDGSMPSTASSRYSGPITLTSSQTVKAIAAGTGYVASTVASETYTLTNQVPTPTFSPQAGNFNTAQSVTISTAWAGSTIYYTTDGSTPTASSAKYTGPISIGSTTTIKAMATAPNLVDSAVASALYTIVQGAASSINFSGGFPAGGMAFVGRAKLSGASLRLTDGATGEASAAWYPIPVNVQGFSTDFTFQQAPGTSPIADGLTFTIQGVGTAAVGPGGGGLGYGASLPGGTPGIAKSVAVKFDLFSNSGEGNNSTGLYTNGASPSKPATTLGGGVNLQNGHVFAVHISYNGSTLTMTIQDTTNVSQTFTTSWPINIPGTVGANTAYVGFTGGTGHYTAVQDILNWTYVSNATGGPQAAATPAINPATGTYSSAQTVTITEATSGATIYYTLDGSQPTTSSTPYAGSFTVNSTTTVKAIATAPNFTQSATATSVITISQSMAATPVISPATGTYSAAQTVTITDSTSGATIYYTRDGSQPTTSSTVYSGSFSVTATTTVKAIAIAPNFTQSATATSVITIQTSGSSTINFGSGFSATGIQFNGHAMLNGTRLQLTDATSTYQAGSAFWTTPVNVQSFTTDFTLQTINPDGITFTIQNVGVTAIGSSSGGLGYGPRSAGGTPVIPQSVCVKFDLYSTAGEGNNSTGLYTNGAQPSIPAVTLGGGVNLRSGDAFQVHMTYDGTTLTMTITDTKIPTETFTTSWTIDIPGTVGGSTAYVGFTAGTGAAYTQQIGTWTYGP